MLDKKSGLDNSKIPSSLNIFFSVMSCSLWDLSFPTRDWILPSVVKAQSSNHWTAREFPVPTFLSIKINLSFLTTVPQRVWFQELMENWWLKAHLLPGCVMANRPWPCKWFAPIPSIFGIFSLTSCLLLPIFLGKGGKNWFKTNCIKCKPAQQTQMWKRWQL